MREVRVTSDDATVIEAGRSEGRLALGGVDLSCGEPIEVWIGDLGWTPVHVESSEALGWVGYLRDGYEGAGSGQASVLVFLHPGLRARRSG